MSPRPEGATGVDRDRLLVVRRLLEEFARSTDDETYRVDEGFFEKLKSAFR